MARLGSRNLHDIRDYLHDIGDYLFVTREHLSVIWMTFAQHC